MAKDGGQSAVKAEALARARNARRRRRAGRRARGHGARSTLGPTLPAQTDIPFREHLVHLWSNHFVAAAGRATAFSMLASFGRDGPDFEGGHGISALAQMGQPACAPPGPGRRPLGGHSIHVG